MLAPAARSLQPLLGHTRPLVTTLLLLGLVTLLLPHLLSIPATISNPTSPVPAAITAVFGKLPLSFVPNAGQSDPSVKFQVSSMGGTLFFMPDEVVLSLPVEQRATSLTNAEGGTVQQPPSIQTVVRLQFDGANATPEVRGGEPLPGIVNYFIGNDPAKWRANVPTYAGIVYKQLYPGIDLAYDGAQGQMKGTYIVAPGVDPTLIRWRYEGASSVQVAASTGDLVIALPSRDAGGGSGERASATLREASPVAWQMIGDRRIAVAARYTIAADGSIGFALGSYDRTQPLVIDPTLVYSSFLGGSGLDIGYAIAVDSASNAYFTGRTSSPNFPTANPLQGTYGGGSDDAFVTKLNAQGSALLYSTFLGGRGDDGGRAITVDSVGNAYLTGVTDSANFPTASPLQATYGGGVYDGFVTKLNAQGSALLYSTFLGGRGEDGGSDIAVDSAGNAYLTGATDSANFPTASPLQATYGGGVYDGFVAKLNAQGSALVYSTFLGGTGFDYGNAMAVDSAGNAYLIGETASANFPTASPLQATFGGSHDAFVTKLNAAGSALLYSTFLGGTAGDDGRGIVVDSAGNAYLMGGTGSANFPTANPLQTTFGGFYDVFVAKIGDGGQEQAGDRLYLPLVRR